jgi:hypothetical protein
VVNDNPIILFTGNMDKRIKTTSDVVFASHVVIRDGIYPSRMVVRKLEEDEYTSHVETLSTCAPNKEVSAVCALEHHSFIDGKYFRWGRCCY